MLARLVLKEIRESLWIVAAALAAYVYYFMTATGVGLGGEEWWHWLSFLRGGDEPGFGLVVSLCLAAGLGLRQTVGESARGTFQFLLHRPASRERLIATKLVVGAGLYLCLATVPLWLIAWWATTPGNAPAPFEWSMLAGSWKIWSSMTIMYFGAFLTGLRPGRWYGTRLLPLIACGFVSVGLSFLPHWWITGLPITVVLDVLLVTNILFVARTRDYS
ncbi:MAG: hypothetical protein JW888_12895 [Pirellulales bacterium]|nr:hypothetical protein [Pirellulales bacterium]